jgi:hypothetical protein
MANPGIQFIAALRRHGAASPANKKQLQDWKLAALTAIGAGESGQAVSVSANGVSAAWSQGMTNLEWFTALDSALQYLDAGLTPSSVTYGRVV